jgi:hypothetical protein
MQPVSKQRLGKQASTIETVFYVVRAATVATQWCGKHASTTEAVFCVVRARSYLEDNWRYSAVES